LLGIIAEVQTRIYYEARGRPHYKIRRIVQHPVWQVTSHGPRPSGALDR
jgi:hypothetical protein